MKSKRKYARVTKQIYKGHLKSHEGLLTSSGNRIAANLRVAEAGWLAYGP
jgi:hypothetical protein